MYFSIMKKVPTLIKHFMLNLRERTQSCPLLLATIWLHLLLCLVLLHRGVLLVLNTKTMMLQIQSKPDAAITKN